MSDAEVVNFAFGMRLFRTFAFCICLLLAIGAPAQTAAAQPPASPAAPAVQKMLDQVSAATQRLRLSPGDEIEIAVAGAPELATHTRVNSDGTIAMPFAGVFKVSGLTAEEAEGVIRDRLTTAKLVKDPQVLLNVKDYVGEGISVTGEVAHPAVFPALGPHRLLDLIQMAGGTTTAAGRKVIIAHRDRPENAETVMLSSDPLLMAQKNVELQPGDTVIVARADLVYVLGEVNQPGAYTVDETEAPTVLKLIALCKGPTGNAALKRARILHRSPDGLSEKPVALENILRARGPDVTLQPDDILMVPSKHHFALNSGTVVQTLTTLVIYRGF